MDEDLYNCTDEFHKCVNTLGSYRCECDQDLYFIDGKCRGNLEVMFLLLLGTSRYLSPWGKGRGPRILLWHQVKICDLPSSNGHILIHLPKWTPTTLLINTPINDTPPKMDTNYFTTIHQSLISLVVVCRFLYCAYVCFPCTNVWNVCMKIRHERKGNWKLKTLNQV